MKIDARKLDIALASKSAVLTELPALAANAVTIHTLRRARNGKDVSTRTVGIMAAALGVGVREIILLEGDDNGKQAANDFTTRV